VRSEADAERMAELMLRRLGTLHRIRERTGTVRGFLLCRAPERDKGVAGSKSFSTDHE